MEKEIDIDDCLGRKTFFLCFVIVILLEQSRCQITQLEIAQGWFQVDADVTFIAQIGGLLQRIFHVDFQAQVQPFPQGD